MLFTLRYHKRARDCNRSFDDSAAKITNRPQHSNSMRIRKNNAYLPIPAHTRAASTPSQLEYAQSSRLDSINSMEKRYQSNLDNSCKIDSSKRAASEIPLCKTQNQKQHGLSKRSSTTADKLQKKSAEGNLLPSPELLAALLKGSSEKLISEQRKEIVAVRLLFYYYFKTE